MKTDIRVKVKTKCKVIPLEVDRAITFLIWQINRGKSPNDVLTQIQGSYGDITYWAVMNIIKQLPV